MEEHAGNCVRVLLALRFYGRKLPENQMSIDLRMICAYYKPNGL